MGRREHLRDKRGQADDPGLQPRQRLAERGGRAEPSPQSIARPSRSALKRDDLALRELAVRLAALTRGELERVELPDDVRESLVEHRSLGSLPARDRQLRFIGRLLRDADAAAVRVALDAVRPEK